MLDNKTGVTREYQLTFSEAIEACIQGKGYIRGENFKQGVYGKLQGDTLVLVNGADRHKVMFNMMIYKDAFKQKYKIFDVASPSAIGLV